MTIGEVKDEILAINGGGMSLEEVEKIYSRGTIGGKRIQRLWEIHS